MTVDLISWLDLDTPSDWPYRSSDDELLKRLSGFGRVNILVGPNNGGKSRLLRAIAGQAGYRLGVAQTTLRELRSFLMAQASTVQALWPPHLVHIGGFHFNQLDPNLVPESLATAGDSLKGVRELGEKLLSAQPNSTTGWKGHGGGSLPRALFEQMHETATALRRYLGNVDAIKVGAFAPSKKVYIPVLRGLRPLQASEEGTDAFTARTRADYFSRSQRDSSPEVFTGQTLYQEVRDHLLGPRDQRDRIRRYEEFLSKHFFDSRGVSLIPRRDADVLYVKIGRAPEHPIHELGDGIQSVIILTYKLFALEKAWFFIEEPELFLHPGLQRKLLQVLLSHSGDHRTFLTTHSNHFLDMSLDYRDVAIYGVQKLSPPADEDDVPASFVVELLNSADETALSLLGVKTSSVFLVNATVWVEGITDRLYLRRLFALYQETLDPSEWRAEEDVHYTFVEYGGTNVVHFAFADGYEESPIQVQRLCGRALVVADGDGGKNQERLDAIRQVLHDRLVVLPAREIENLLPWSTLAATIADFEKCEPSELPSEAPGPYLQKYLGRYIERKVLAGSPKRAGGYAAESGTLKSKRAFCERALGHLDADAFDALSPDAKGVLERIYCFVRDQHGSAER